MIDIRKCRNKCIFCFVDQLPEGLRKTLYIKDDDYLLSYTNNNFITLTNLSKKDAETIIKYELKPLYISVHSIDPEIRKKIFGSNLNEKSIENLKLLDNAGIDFHIQIVLCPGINDGRDLINTLDGLNRDCKNIKSIGIVPVGITKFNSSDVLKPFERKKSLDLIKLINDYKKNDKQHGEKIKNIYLADEYYIMAEIDFPDYSSYNDFPQIGNGIGKSIDFLKSVEESLKTVTVRRMNNSKKILLVTSEYGEKIISRVIELINEKITGYRYEHLFRIDLCCIRNNFFGGNIKVTGLLTGRDLIKNIKKINFDDFDKMLLPDCVFNKDFLTIDDYRKEDLQKICDKIHFIPDDGSKLIEGIFN